MDAPWTNNKEWASGRISSHSGGAVILVWVFAGLSNALIWTASYLFYLQEGEGDVMKVMALFCVVGVGLLVWAAKRTWQWIRHGSSTLELSSVPGVIGGTLEGALHTRLREVPEKPIELTLTCNRQYVVKAPRNSKQGDRIELPAEVTSLRVQGASGFEGFEQGSWVKWPEPASGMRLDDLDSSLRSLEKAGLVKGIVPTRLGEAAAAHFLSPEEVATIARMLGKGKKPLEVAVELESFEALYLKFAERISVKLRMQISQRALHGSFLDLLGSSDLRELENKIQRYCLDFARDFLRCTCKEAPYCGCPQKNISLRILELLEPLEHSAHGAHPLGVGHLERVSQ